MRQWSKLHPYNAGQVVQVSGTADAGRWENAVSAVIRELGLGTPRFFNGDECVEFMPCENVKVEVVDAAHSDMQPFFNRELNRPFGPCDMPIRFALLPAPPQDGKPTHYLVAVYDHWIADSRAMRELMHRIFERYQRPEAQATLPPLTLESPAFTKLYRRHGGPWKRLTGARESLKNVWRHRRGYRINLIDPLDFNSRFMFRELPEGLIQKLYRFSKNRGASVNDLFIAVIAQTMGKYTAGDRCKPRRKKLHYSKQQVGIGTIVDIRDAANQPLENVFNVYLSSYTVLLDEPEKKPADEVTRLVAGETSWIKRTFANVRGVWAMMTVQFWYSVYDSPRFRASLLHKTVPMVAGISNVNMTRSWADAKTNAAKEPPGGELPRVLDYIRISPAGPLIPLVFTLTTIGGRLSLCVTYRTTSFREDKAVEVVEDFVRRLQEVGKEP